MPDIPKHHKNKFLYHFTHVDNLDSILKNGLVSTNLKDELEISHVNVANSTIQARRKTMAVTCGPKGSVHDYVPFYFCTRNPMLLALVNSKNVDQNDVIILAVPIERLFEANGVFTDAAANANTPPNFYDDPEDLDELNWEEIKSQKWKSANDDLKHQKMAEALIFEKVPLEYIEKIIVWNDKTRDLVIKAYKDNSISKPYIGPESAYGPYFFYTKFMVKGGQSHLLVRGPRVLKKLYKTCVSFVIQKKFAQKESEFLFDDLEDCLKKIRLDFCAIKELKDINGLETDNDVHNNTVSDHTLEVVENIKKQPYFKSASENDKRILELSAYLHDIGKGPSTKWKNGKQPAYPDHPGDAAEMVARILVEDIKLVSEDEIRMICMLVIYHDLIGEIFGKGRHQEQLTNIIKDEHDFDMLDTLNYADVLAINWEWAYQYRQKRAAFKIEILGNKGLI